MKGKIGYLFASFGLYFPFVIVSFFAILATDIAVVELLGYPSIKELFHLSRKNIDVKRGAFEIILLYPILEELLFRLVLIPKRINRIIFAFLWSIFLIRGILIPLAYDIEFLKIVGCSVLITLLLDRISIMLKLDEKIKFVEKYITILSILCFGLIHLDNIKHIYPELFFIYPIYVLPQLFIGYLCSNLRLKFGFVWGVLLHCMINLVGVIL